MVRLILLRLFFCDLRQSAVTSENQKRECSKTSTRTFLKMKSSRFASVFLNEVFEFQSRNCATDPPMISVGGVSIKMIENFNNIRHIIAKHHD